MNLIDETNSMCIFKSMDTGEGSQSSTFRAANHTRASVHRRGPLNGGIVEGLTADHSRCRVLRVLRTLHIKMVRVIVFNATFNNISVISWRSVLLVEETSTRRKTPTCHKSLTNFII